VEIGSKVMKKVTIYLTPSVPLSFEGEGEEKERGRGRGRGAFSPLNILQPP